MEIEKLTKWIKDCFIKDLDAIITENFILDQVILKNGCP